jgi:RNA polymerase sigma-70 factor (ECF subfamily)
MLYSRYAAFAGMTLTCINAVASRSSYDFSGGATGGIMRQEADPFRVLYVENRERVRRLLERIVGPQEAEDLTQTVFAKAATALPSFRGEAQPSTWLYRIAANVASDWLRSRSPHEAKLTVGLREAPDHETREAGADTARNKSQASPEQELIRKEMNDCIRDVITALPDNHRAVLVLGALGGFTDEEIARTLQISRSNAKVRLHRARAELKQALDQRCDFYHTEDNELACEPKPGACGASSTKSGCSRAAGSDR